MARDGTPTHQRIMDAALELILEQGYSATSLERLIERAGIAKGTFFYHFPTKQALAEALVRRWAEEDIAQLDNYLARVRKLARDPAQQLLIFVGLLVELFEQPAEQPPGCLYASFCYEAGLFDPAIGRVIRATFDTYRERLGPLVDAAIEANPPRGPVTADELVDLLSVVFEGGFILSRIYGDASMVATHLRHYRNYVELVFGV